MSSALLKKSLELMECEYARREIEKAGSIEQYSQIKLISKSNKQKELRGVADVKKRSLKAVEKVKKKVKDKTNKVAENLKKLKELHKLSVDDKIINLILKDSNKFHSENYIPPEESKTAFTEEDFIAFEKEYFGN